MTINNQHQVSCSGDALLNNPLLNKGSAFSEDERKKFGLTGLLPQHYETIDQQVARAYQQFLSFAKNIDRYSYLRTIQDTNETLFYRLLRTYIEEMMPIIYTPVVGEACEHFSAIYRHPRGLFIAYPDRDAVDDMLNNISNDNIGVIVVTDGSRILGLGDQGAGGMVIPIGKLNLYTVCGGVNPADTLPVMLDTGTDNQKLLDDPLYIGWHHNRITQTDYDAFLDSFISAVKRRWPGVLLQFEDFQQSKALSLLNRYRQQICCFNDDIQGTAAITTGLLLAACRTKNERLSDQKIVIAGAGSAGCGIAAQIIRHMRAQGMTEYDARCRIFMVDRDGLVVDKNQAVADFKKKALLSKTDRDDWHKGTRPSLLDTIKLAVPTVLIGVSGQAGLFSEVMIKAMIKHCQNPVILPLGNPSKHIEATPRQLIEWTDGRALVATGSPFEPFVYKGRNYTISQCNNSYIFPSFGLAVIAGKISYISDEMLSLASDILAASAHDASNNGALLPPLTDISDLSKKIALAVAELAQQQGYATKKLTSRQLAVAIEQHAWQPDYLEYKRA